MFTNWLTNSVPNNGAPRSAVAAAAANSRRAEEGAFPLSAAAMTTLSNVASANHASLAATPPDVVLEVGAAPSVRFVAHSVVLGAHSGYLRSVIRLDERLAGNGPAPGAGPEPVLYLGNVTPEQFAPLLTYMYTGYLDLSVENIFAVLLATHVLHMPRALEICRSFLGRSHADGYLGTVAASSSAKVIRPIPSKAALPNFGFVAPPLGHHLPLPPPAAPPPTTAAYLPLPVAPSALHEVVESPERQEPENNATNDDDDEEVFIESNEDSVAPPDSDCNISVTSSTRDVDVEKEILLDVVDASQEQPPPSQRTDVVPEAPTPPVKQPSARSLAKREKLRQNRSNKQSRRQKSPAAAVAGLQIAKAPILAGELDAERGGCAVTAAVAEREKVIIDVASCDGPVRFRRILNAAYGHQLPEGGGLPTERSQQSVSLSFHQQMAKAISQQRQLQHAEESENSESSGSGGGAASCGAGKGPKVAANEVFVCVYCKHSFKSQYCYQKHAKRHLNPLSLSGGNAEAGCSAAAAQRVEEGDGRRPPTGSRVEAATAAELLRREVRPLDMNVQYYPCKTCGSKFPSYYFVHKHRKMCHAEEEAQEAEGRRTAAGSSAAAPPATHKKLDAN